MPLSKKHKETDTVITPIVIKWSVYTFVKGAGAGQAHLLKVQLNKYGFVCVFSIVFIFTMC